MIEKNQRVDTVDTSNYRGPPRQLRPAGPTSVRQWIGRSRSGGWQETQRAVGRLEQSAVFDHVDPIAVFHCQHHRLKGQGVGKLVMGNPVSFLFAWRIRVFAVQTCDSSVLVCTRRDPWRHRYWIWLCDPKGNDKHIMAQKFFPNAPNDPWSLKTIVVHT